MASSSSDNLKQSLDDNWEEVEGLISLCRNIASEIEAGSITLHVLVDVLKSYITKEINITTARGIAVLSLILSVMSLDNLTEVELNFVTIFYCNIMTDHYYIITPVLNGILVIVNMTHLPKHAPSSLLKTIFQNIDCQSQQTQERYTVYLIFKKLFENQLDVLKNMGPELVNGIISCINGERELKNLRVLFDILSQYMKDLPLGHLTKEMFEVLASYFPVDFNLIGVTNLNTRKDLAEKLAPCLYATPEFAPYCITLIIAKVSSTFKIAKLDCFYLLRDSVETFGPLRMREHLNELWIVLQKEILSATDIEVKNAALEALVSLMKNILSDENVCQPFINRLIHDIKVLLYHGNIDGPIQEVLKIFTIDKTIYMQSVKVFVPLCIEQYNRFLQNNSLKEIMIRLEILNDFLKMCCFYGFCIQDVSELAWTNVPQIYLDSLSIQNVTLKSKLFVGLTLQKTYLSCMQRCIFYKAICNEIAIGSEGIQVDCHKAIIDFAASYHEEILEQIVETLLSNLDETHLELMNRKITALSRIAKIQTLGSVILPRLVGMLIKDGNIKIAILFNIQNLLNLKSLDFNVHHFLCTECDIINQLVLCETNNRNHKLVCNVCQLLVRNLAIEEQRAIAAKYAAAVLTANILEIDIVHVDVIMNLLIPLQRDINLNIKCDTVENLCYLAFYKNFTLNVQNAACMFLSVALNKMEITDLDGIMSNLEEKLNNSLRNTEGSIKMRRMVDLYVWVTKALITKGYCKSQYFLENLTHLLIRSDRIGRYVADQYQIVARRNENILTEENCCSVQMFYKQKVFEYLLNQNVNFTNSIRGNYLVALIHLINEMCEELLHLYLVKLVPLLIECLSFTDKNLVLLSLTLLKYFLNTKHEVFSDAIECLIPRLLQLSNYNFKLSIKVRIAAMQCLICYANYPIILIIPYKQLILNSLAKMSFYGDRKRLIQSAANQASSIWFTVGASEDSRE